MWRRNLLDHDLRGAATVMRNVGHIKGSEVGKLCGTLVVNGHTGSPTPSATLKATGLVGYLAVIQTCVSRSRIGDSSRR